MKVVGCDICELLDIGKEMVFYQSVHDTELHLEVY